LHFSLDEDLPRLRFERNPLESVVWQMRFPPLLSIDDGAVVGRFQAAIGAEYPLAERGEGGADAPAPWHFRDPTETWTVALFRDSLALQTVDYLSFEDFRARLERLLAAVEETLAVTHTLRLGLRYVDHIDPPDATTPEQFARYLNEDLIGVVAGPRLSPYVVDALQFIRLRVSSHEMTVRHGFVGPLTGEPGAPFYLMDTDAYRYESAPYDRSRCLEAVDGFKRNCWSFFRQSIRDELVDYMGAVRIDA
jgi:uncharacterized protein (TIGR04255 family)